MSQFDPVLVHTNPELELAEQYVRSTDRNLFLTGKAGTGKTTFLHNLRRDCDKRMIVTAPTGVAAIHAGGVTLHSFFQLPFGPIVPGIEAQDPRAYHRFSKEKVNIIRSLDLLVIDEISMVRADVLDGVDAVLRQHRRSDAPFGGVQLLMIGDLSQLAPVAKDEEWALLRSHYRSPYFFCSQALARTNLVSIELKQIYRQSDGRFIELLNRVRDNDLDSASLAEINRRYLPGFTPPDDEGYITLTTHNRTAEALNRQRLASLSGSSHRFKAQVEGEFPDYMFPTEALLELKEGAQVMFVRNDPSHDKSYYNGKIGSVTRIEASEVLVRCQGETRDIVVGPVSWDNTKYAMDAGTKEIVASKVGTFTQMPLKLAWAITIHKSQGLTFEHAVIDAKAAFAPGQVYVAMSRCKSLEGLVLSAPLSAGSVLADDEVQEFVTEAAGRLPRPEDLLADRRAYQRRLVLECFDFEKLGFRVDRWVRLVQANSNTVTVLGADDWPDLYRRCRAEIVDVGERFGRQLEGLFRAAPAALVESDGAVIERVSKASAYFGEKIEALFVQGLSEIEIATDNKEIRKQAGGALKDLQLEIAVKLAAVRSCQAGFSPARYLRAIAIAAMEPGAGQGGRSRVEPGPRGPSGDAPVGAEELLGVLRQWRAQRAAEANVPHYQILHQEAIFQIARTLPGTAQDLRRLKGIGDKTVKKYGEELLALVLPFRQAVQAEREPD